MITCILATQKNEEQYLNEWIEYHLNLGFDYIIIGDNNDIGNELQISNYNGKVIVVPLNHISIREISGDHVKLLSNIALLYQLYKNNIDYCCSIDIDEFLELKTHNNIKDFISDVIIPNDIDVLSIRWESYDDNNLIYKSQETGSVINDYKHNIIKRTTDDWCTSDELSWSKMIFNPKLLYGLNIQLTSHALKIYSHEDEYGIPAYYVYSGTLIDTDIAVVNHFRTKCLEQYLYTKCILNGSINEPYTGYGNNIIQTYFAYNKITREKINACIELCEKYNIPLSESDKLFLE